ncbi:hypothetical protein [Cupriavidus basilensis]|uniref:hypothetical protein n=1 Tax=Cupriavidus basilensis TaxID=68895 RepID=UPI0020A6D644|nr:hypothetical protein [Cupriavidus basilensis]MCP3017415.1 hypothetical protein [Cupriavidus basilensis]
MGAWAYCSHPGCEQGLSKPTGREAIEGEQYCADGHRNHASMTRDEYVVELSERVEELESEVATLSVLLARVAAALTFTPAPEDS